MARIMIVGFGNEGTDMAATLAASLGPVAHIAGIAGNPAPPTGIEIVVLDGDRGDGLEAVRYWHASGVDSILLSQELSVAAVLPAIRAGAQEILQKPVDMGKLERVLDEMLERRRPTIHGLARRIDEFVLRHAGREAFCLRDVGRQFNISPGYVSRLYRRYVGTSFRSRLLDVRIRRAKRLIERTDDPFYLVAARCGFRSSGRLTEAFRRVEGMPPKSYREICRVNSR